MTIDDILLAATLETAALPCGADIWGAYIDGYPKEVITN
jgi:hypothetical protein